MGVRVKCRRNAAIEYHIRYLAQDIVLAKTFVDWWGK